MIKRILISLDPSPYSNSVIEYGCRLAAKSGAELTGLSVLNLPGIAGAVGAVPAGGIHYAAKMKETRIAECEAENKNIVDCFAESCQKNGVKMRVLERKGDPEDELIAEANFYDRIVVGLRTPAELEDQDKEGPAVQRILANTITPLIAVPEKMPTLDDNHQRFNALMTFDGNQLAARAMHRFARVGDADMYNVKILMSSKNKDRAMILLNQAQEYLTSHGFDNVKTRWTSQSIIDTVKERYMDWADKIVLGMHSKRGLVDFMVGSLSKFLIHNGTKMLLFG